MAICNVSSKELSKWRDTTDELYKYFLYADKFGNKKRAVFDRFTDYNGNFNNDVAHRVFKDFVWHQLELPIDSNVPLPKDLVRRIKVEIDAYDKRLKGKFGNYAFIVPEGISKQDPTARKFQLELNKIIDTERTNINSLMSSNGKIADHLTEAYLTSGQVGMVDKVGKKVKTSFESIYKGKGAESPAVQKLREIRRKMAEAPDERTQVEYIGEMEKFIKSDKGETIRQFIELIHMPKDLVGENLKNVRKKDFKDTREFLEDGIENPNYNRLRSYNAHVVEAVKEARVSLNEMGNVFVRGLQGLQKIVAVKYTGTSDIKLAMTNPKAKKLLEAIDGSIENIQIGLKKGGYFPHASFENVVQLKEAMNKAMNENAIGKEAAYENIVNDIISTINLSRIPDPAKGRNPRIKQYWEKDPLLVISEYGNQAVAFNKLVYTQKSYLESIREMPNSNTKFIKGLKTFIDEQYTVFTKGTAGRADWANKAVTTLNALQTARTMGLNITGAVKNAASAIHFYSRVGFSTLGRAVKAVNERGEFSRILEAVEKEQGFLFTDAASELYSEGLISQRDLRSGRISFDPISGQLKNGGSKLKDYLANAGSWTLDKALFFHRITENNQRKWMFRTAFHQKWMQLNGMGYDPQTSQRMATAHALKMVNGWAYEYAAHGKAKMVRGEWRTIDTIENQGVIAKKLTSGVMGAGSEIAFHLMHYPMSLMESHWSSLKGAMNSIKAKQGLGSSQELQYLLRYGGVSALLGLIGAITNTDLTNIFENETQERLGRVITDLTEFDNPDRGTFGLLSEFTGPTIGTMKHLGIVGGIIDIEHSDLNKILFGNVDFADDDDKLTELYAAYQYSTAWGVLKNKTIPALKSGRGRDLFMHTLKLYPSATTKKRHELIFGKEPDKRKTKKKYLGVVPNSDLDRSLQLLEQFSAGKVD